MASFYQMTRSQGISNILGGSTYIGADNSIGVAVIRNSLAKSVRLDSQIVPVKDPLILRGLKSPDRSPKAGPAI